MNKATTHVANLKRQAASERAGQGGASPQDEETKTVATALVMLGMPPKGFSPTHAQLAEAWVLMGLVSVAPIVEEVLER